jgi:hypothetical protein
LKANRRHNTDLIYAIVPVIIVALLALGACLWLAARSAFGSVEVPVTTDWLEDLSIDRYRAMLRLLDDAELQFLREQPGYSPQIEKRFRKKRCEVARVYLREMRGDFKRICAVLKIFIVQSQQDRPDLASALMQSQWAFARGVLAYEFRLVLFRYGLPGLDVPEIFGIFEGMRLELRTLIPAAELA